MSALMGVRDGGIEGLIPICKSAGIIAHFQAELYVHKLFDNVAREAIYSTYKM